MENTPNTTPQIDNDKLWGILAYIFFLIPLLFAKPRSAFLTYHINQGIILFFVIVIGNFGLDFLPWWIGILAIFKWVWNVLALALLVIGIQNVLQRVEKPLPVIGKLFTFLK